MDYKKFLLSKEGRISRKTYWIDYYLKIHFPVIIVGIILDLIFETNDKFMTLASFVMLFPSIVVSIKRAHDRNRSNWFVLLLLIPIINLWPIIELGFLKGTIGSNQYGEDPLSLSNSAVA